MLLIVYSTLCGLLIIPYFVNQHCVSVDFSFLFFDFPRLYIVSLKIFFREKVDDFSSYLNVRNLN